MTNESLWQLEVGAVMVVGIVAWVAYVRSGSVTVRAAQRARDEAQRYTRPTQQQDGADESPAPKPQLGRLLAQWGSRLPLFNDKQRATILRKLTAGGFRQVYALQAFVAIKVLCGALGVVEISTMLSMRLPDTDPFIAALAMMAGLFVGMIEPEIALNIIVKRRQKKIHRFLSDALDLMVICTNAGYSLNATIRSVAKEMRPICRPLADELELTFHETQLNADTVVALRNLAERTGVESLRALVATLIQSHRYGTPITQALKILARTERTARLLRLEEQGAKLAVKLTMPMMLLILPAVFIIIGGPAFLQLSEAFGK